ncbi:hypothetical protein J5N97_026030 [Dioscorea zingiberensis]|uniref:Bulb-type lectin domain-containing protein n=1 Tax=Dioscorea zingiberensis TaxID=325984 RepID=A0A9D5H6H0_9LILI|nr:hypothetical protein J5N97_026030 [Dioscorea zingiberensis]
MSDFTLLLLQLLILLSLWLCSSSTSAQTYQNISLGTTITITTSWLSPSGDFAVGFLPLPANSSLFVLAIWFTKTSTKTIVWYANGDSPVSQGSKLQLTSDGQLLLTDHSGLPIWNPYPSGGASYAAMLDTGNLILTKADSTPTWQSFNFPTNTILPTQVLHRNATLRSHLYEDDLTGGKFELSLQSNGNLMMFPVALPTNLTYDAYWATNTQGSGTQLVFDLSGTLYLLLANATRINISTSSISTAISYQRATLDSDGVLRHYMHRGDNWTVISSVPSNMCESNFGGTGSGACGFNSYCQFDDQNLQRICSCPPSFSFLNPDKPYQGCKPDFETPICTTGGDQSGMFEFKEMENVDWPGSDYEHYNSFNETQCRENCINDCFCAVAFSRGLDCWKKKLPLANGRAATYLGGKALIKVSKFGTIPPPLSAPPQLISNTKKGKSVWLIVGLLSLALSLLILLGSIVNIARRPSSKHKSIQLGSCCRRSLELELSDEEEAVLAYWAYDCYRKGKVKTLVGEDTEAMANLDGVVRLLMIAIWCIQEEPSQRPTMRRVNQMLDGDIVDPPPNPSSSSEKFIQSPDCCKPLLGN